MTTLNITSGIEFDTRKAVALVSHLSSISDGQIMLRKFSNEIDRQVNARSTVGILSLSIKNGDLLTVTCYDKDEAEEKLTVAKIAKWFEDNKG